MRPLTKIQNCVETVYQ